MSSFIISIILLLGAYGCTNFTQEQSKSIMIPVRDGTKLATDLYFPDLKSNSYPAILIRTPYNKILLKEYGEFYSKRGYVTVIQDVRGKYGSEGNWMPYEVEGDDGYDIIEWLANQGWSNGKIGMVGGSYSGSVQIAAAIEAPPHLVTIIPNITPATPFNNTPYENGVFALGWGIRWSNIVDKNITGQEMNEKFAEVFHKNWYLELNHLPVIDLDKKVAGKEIDFWRKWINNEPGENSYYDEQDYLLKIQQIDIPVFLQSGWFDVANRGTKMIYKSLIESGNNNIKLIIGPWVHSDRSSTKLGPLYLGEEAGIDLFNLYTKWFDYWLKGIDNGILNEPMVWILHVGYAWMIVGLFLLALSGLGIVSVSVALHALTAGSIGSMTLGMMCRVALGHTGRNLVTTKLTLITFVLMQVIVIIRVLGVIFLPEYMMSWIVLSAGLWSLCFALYLLIYAPMLMRARPDARAA